MPKSARPFVRRDGRYVIAEDARVLFLARLEEHHGELLEAAREYLNDKGVDAH
ncbi:hypothetical protein [Actinokineospora sp. NBRC 105648]|uniref:hypothetical protein n=1 Tax=Actinokineospora sp. NBRC 105648 TaxID=3032206 RepID=UPI0025550301|nr:hypothetical protein [Actinokineospora sp. NBRC 105648]